MRKIIAAVLLILLTASCGRIKNNANDITFEKGGSVESGEISLNANDFEAAVSAVKAVVITDINGTVDDASYMQSVWNGLSIAGEELGIAIDYKSPSSEDEYANLVNEALDEGANIIFAYGGNTEPVKESAAKGNEFTYFVLLDPEGNSAGSKNLKRIDFFEEELGFTAGYFAALETKTGSIGFLGINEDEGFIKELRRGFEFGVSEAKPSAKVHYEFSGDTDTGAKKAAGLLEDKGCDIIFAPAGRFSADIIDAASKSKIIGCDINQSYLSKEKVAASAIRHFDMACYNAIKDMLDGSFSESDDIEGGIKEGYLEFNIASDSGGETESRMRKVYEALSNGAIKISDI